MEAKTKNPKSKVGKQNQNVIKSDLPAKMKPNPKCQEYKDQNVNPKAVERHPRQVNGKDLDVSTMGGTDPATKMPWSPHRVKSEWVAAASQSKLMVSPLANHRNLNVGKMPLNQDRIFNIRI